MPLLPHDNPVWNVQGLITISQQISTFDDSREWSKNTESCDSFGIYSIKIKFFIFGVVVHIGLVEAEFARVLLLESQPGSHHFWWLSRHRLFFHWNYYLNTKSSVCTQSKDLDKVVDRLRNGKKGRTKQRLSEQSHSQSLIQAHKPVSRLELSKHLTGIGQT